MNLRSLLLAGGMTLAATAATAETYRLTTYAPPTEGASIHNTFIAEQVCEKTGGEVCFEIFYASSLVPAAGQMKGIGDGVAHAGFQAMGYVPSDAPLNNALTAYGFIEQNPTAIAMAFADWGMHDPAALEQYKKNNVVPFGGFSTPTYPFICNTSEPITSLDQFQGLKVPLPRRRERQADPGPGRCRGVDPGQRDLPGVANRRDRLRGHPCRLAEHRQTALRRFRKASRSPISPAATTRPHILPTASSGPV